MGSNGSKERHGVARSPWRTYFVRRRPVPARDDRRATTTTTPPEDPATVPQTDEDDFIAVVSGPRGIVKMAGESRSRELEAHRFRAVHSSKNTMFLIG